METEKKGNPEVKRGILEKYIEADILNQAGYASMYPFFVSLYEYKQFPNGNEKVID